MPTLYLKANSQIVENAVNYVTKQFSAKERKNVETFIRCFFEFNPASFLQTFSTEELGAFVKESYLFLKKRKRGSQQVRIYNPSLEKNGFAKEYTVIEMINDDMPFLVDSISEELNRHGLAIHYLTHPVIDVTRDKSGEIISLDRASRDEKSKNAESLIHFQISYIAEEKQRISLKDDLLHILKCVKCIVDDWQKMLSHITPLQDYLTNVQDFNPKKNKSFDDDVAEVQQFVSWLTNGNFIFLGTAKETLKGSKFSIDKDAKFGLFATQEIWIPNLSKSNGTIDSILDTVHITKSSEKSPVHRSAHMDLISIQIVDKKGKPVEILHILGLFTSIVYYQSAQRIPLLRHKINLIRKKSGFPASGHSGKALIAILEDFPRDELFQSPIDEIFETALGIVTLTTTPKVKLFVRRDESERFISCLVFIPRDRMSTALRKKIENILATELNGTISNHYTQISDSNLARLQIIVKTVPGKIANYDLQSIEKRIESVSKIWNDDLFNFLVKKLGEKDGISVYGRYKDSFSLSYTNRFSSQDAYYDILKIDEILQSGKIAFDLYEATQETDKNAFHLKIYNPKVQISLSKIMPILDNLGATVIDEHTYQVSPKGEKDSIWIHRFRFVIASSRPNLKDIKDNFEQALSQIWSEKVQNDKINELIILANINCRQAVLLRTYIKYLQQIRFSYSQIYVQEALACHPRTVKLLVQLFYTKFDPEFKGNRQNEVKKISGEIEKILGTVSNLAEDRVIRALLEVINATWRTNFFQKTLDNDFKEYISIKINSASISFMPKPKPYTEIYVYSPRVSGIHLRGGKVARGGLRWSDRREDFRTEVLGLMKAQMTKNAVIIPVGSKGGFVVKKVPSDAGRDALLKEGIECYKIFLRGLLDITDNLVGGKIKPPVDVVRYDLDDPYLVVAADKGTATFSDIANSVAAEYNFWLGDAFASGGSVGYDHKKMGITARGAWISVERHFKDIGIDTSKDNFTAVGIGDMSGDVFGNGLLRSEHTKLVAAFNHMHIFIDPNPDAKKSFAERLRLFNLPRSTWNDYDKKLISKGGGVFERNAKSISISKEAQKLLDVSKPIFTPDELIQAILKAPIDLLWNGGIGTYVKAKTESNESVGDKTNDALRVNGEELRFKVVGEGGNLGFTQLGRIEYAEKGGRLNTDAVDNSAGVDCSDHEVNIKIALNSAVSAKKFSLAERNTLLEQMTDEVAELVLSDNKLQTQFISIARHQANDIIEGHARAIDSLEEEGLLDRKIEFLPSKEEILRRHAQGKGLTRPEISVLMAYSKISLFDALLKSKLPDDSHYLQDLESYFPKKMRIKFAKEIHNHPLRREIIATSIANSVINRIGIKMYFLLKESTGMEACDIARAYTAVRDCYNLKEIWDNIESLNNEVPSKVQIDLFLAVRDLIEVAIFWLLNHFKNLGTLSDLVGELRSDLQKLTTLLPSVLSPVNKKAYEATLQYYKANKVPDSLAKSVSSLQFMVSGLNIVQEAKKNKLDIETVAKIYFQVSDELQLHWLNEQLNNSTTSSYWQQTSIKTLIDDIFTQQKRITSSILKASKSKKGKADLKLWLQDNHKQVGRYLKFISDLKASDQLDFAMILVAVGKLKEIAD